MRFFEKFVKPYKNLGEEQRLYALFIMNYEVCFFSFSHLYLPRKSGSYYSRLLTRPHKTLVFLVFFSSNR